MPWNPFGAWPSRTRRCWACRERYERRLPNCPRCKAKPSERSGSAASGFIPSRQKP